MRMANQIAANFAHHPREQAAAEVAAHLRSFWAPSMRSALIGDLGAPELDPIVTDALNLLRAQASSK